MQVGQFPAAAANSLIEGYCDDFVSLSAIFAQTLEQVTMRQINIDGSRKRLAQIEHGMQQLASAVRDLLDREGVLGQQGEGAGDGLGSSNALSLSGSQDTETQALGSPESLSLETEASPSQLMPEDWTQNQSEVLSDRADGYSHQGGSAGGSDSLYGHLGSGLDDQEPASPEAVSPDGAGAAGGSGVAFGRDSMGSAPFDRDLAADDAVAKDAATNDAAVGESGPSLMSMTDWVRRDDAPTGKRGPGLGGPGSGGSESGGSGQPVRGPSQQDQRGQPGASSVRPPRAGLGAQGRGPSASSRENARLGAAMADKFGVRATRNGGASGGGSRQPPKAAGMKGTNSSMPVLTVFQFVERMRKSGEMRVDLSGELLRFEFHNGCIQACISNQSMRGERLGDILIECGACTPEELNALMQRIGRCTSMQLGDAAVREGIVSNGQILDALERQVRRRFQRACRSANASYEFFEGSASASDGRIRITPMELSHESRL
ncbi:MAG: DUF4388 domain-containing protein [Planctomycetota bacterium]